jgi:glutathione S-transferase
MYTLYTIPGSCSTGIHILLSALKQPFTLIEKSSLADFNELNPAGSVPVLDDNGFIIREGGAIALYLLEKHTNNILPTDIQKKNIFIQQLLFNYATLQPAYNRLFFAMKHLQGNTQKEVYAAAAKDLSRLWKIVDQQLSSTPFFSGNNATIIDYLLCIYSHWGQSFDIEITLGNNVTRMIKEVMRLPECQQIFNDEGIVC